MTPTVHSSRDNVPQRSANTETITITPTLETKRVLATLLLKSYLNDGWELSPNVFDWAVGVLKSEDESGVEYVAAWQCIDSEITKFAKDMLSAIADNEFQPLTVELDKFETRLRLLKEYGVVHVLYSLEEIAIKILNEVERQARDENFMWAFMNEDSDVPSRLDQAKKIMQEQRAWSEYSSDSIQGYIKRHLG